MKWEDFKDYATYSFILKEACVSGLNCTRNSNIICICSFSCFLYSGSATSNLVNFPLLM